MHGVVLAAERPADRRDRDDRRPAALGRLVPSLLADRRRSLGLPPRARAARPDQPDRRSGSAPGLPPVRAQRLLHRRHDRARSSTAPRASRRRCTATTATTGSAIRRRPSTAPRSWDAISAWRMPDRLLITGLSGSPGRILVTDGLIEALDGDEPPDVPTIDGAGLSAAPGFIELQVNGVGDADFTAEPASIHRGAAMLPRHGVTSFLPTIVSSPRGTVEAALASVAGPPQPGWGRPARPSRRGTVHLTAPPRCPRPRLAS